MNGAQVILNATQLIFDQGCNGKSLGELKRHSSSSLDFVIGSCSQGDTSNGIVSRLLRVYTRLDVHTMTATLEKAALPVLPWMIILYDGL